MNKSYNYLICRSFNYSETKHKCNPNSFLINHRIDALEFFSCTTMMETTSPHLLAISDGLIQTSKSSKQSCCILTQMYNSWLDVQDNSPIQPIKFFQSYLDKTIKHKFTDIPSTLVSAIFNGHNFTIFNNGGSRAYLIDLREINPSVKTHYTSKHILDNCKSTKEKGESNNNPFNGKKKNLVVRFRDYISTTEYQPGQLLLLCSQEVNLYLSEKEISDHFLYLEGSDPSIHQLAQLARDRGGNNISFICVGYATTRDLKLRGYLPIGSGELSEFYMETLKRIKKSKTARR